MKYLLLLALVATPCLASQNQTLKIRKPSMRKWNIPANAPSTWMSRSRK